MKPPPLSVNPYSVLWAVALSPPAFGLTLQFETPEGVARWRRAIEPPASRCGGKAAHDRIDDRNRRSSQHLGPSLCIEAPSTEGD